MTSTEPVATVGDVLDALRAMTPEQRAEVWPDLVETFKLMRLSPLVFSPAADALEPNPHGHFRSHLDLPITTPEQAQRMAPVFSAVYELVKQHQHCRCDPTVMAWRAAYTAALVLLAPTPPDGPFSEPCFGDMPDGVWWGWRCSLPHGDYTAVVERRSKGWDRRDAGKAYRSHVKAKHPEQEASDE